MATNMQHAMNTAAANRTRVAASKNTPMPATNDDLAAQMAQLQAQMAQLMALNAQKDAQIEELKKAGPAKKAEKPAPSPENMSITVKGNILTITVDLSKDTGKHTANGANLIIAQQNSAVGPYHVTYAGKDHWISCCVARPEDNAKELRAAYRAAKKQQ